MIYYECLLDFSLQLIYDMMIVTRFGSKSLEMVGGRLLVHTNQCLPVTIGQC